MVKKEKQLELFDLENVKSEKDKDLMNPDFRKYYYEKYEFDRGMDWKNEMNFQGLKWNFDLNSYERSK